VILLALPLLIWCLLRVSLPAGPYAMDQGGHRGSFFPLMAFYSAWAYVIFFASLLGAFFSYCESANASLSLFLVAAIEALLFAGLILFFYERFLHATASGTSNYTLNKYAVTLSLGLSAILTFILAVGVAVVK
jgi:hypothetical protein